MKRHRLRVDGAFGFTGPDAEQGFDVEGLGTVQGPGLANWAARYYLVAVLRPFRIDGELVEQFLCSPRHAGDTLERVTDGECVVGMARVRGSSPIAPGDTIDPDRVRYCAIGTISLAHDDAD